YCRNRVSPGMATPEPVHGWTSLRVPAISTAPRLRCTLKRILSEALSGVTPPPRGTRGRPFPEWSGRLFRRRLLDDHILRRHVLVAPLAGGGDRFYAVDHVHALDHAAEHGVAPALLGL